MYNFILIEPDVFLFQLPMEQKNEIYSRLQAQAVPLKAVMYQNRVSIWNV